MHKGQDQANIVEVYKRDCLFIYICTSNYAERVELSMNIHEGNN